MEIGGSPVVVFHGWDVKVKEQRSDLCPKGIAKNEVKLTVIGDYNAIDTIFQGLLRILNGSHHLSQFF